MRRRLIKNLLSEPCTEALGPAAPEDLEALGAALRGALARRLGRSLAIREVDAGSCNGCELEIHALNNAFYDIERFGIRFVASPRHADVLLVTGPVTLNMREALERTYAATPAPKWVVAVGRLRSRLRRVRRQLRVRGRRRQGPARGPRDSRLPADPRAAVAGAVVASYPGRRACRR